MDQEIHSGHANFFLDQPESGILASRLCALLSFDSC